MKILTADQIRLVDQQTIKLEPILSVDLMERAAIKCYEWIKDSFPNSHTIAIFCGPGNNGGDGLAIARMLSQSGYTVHVYLLTAPDKLSADALSNYHRIITNNTCLIYFLESFEILPELSRYNLIIDALFGTGLSRPFSGLVSNVINALNKQENIIISIDLPSGLLSEQNTLNDSHAIVKANYTLTFQLPKLSFMFAENDPFVGKWIALDIGLHAQTILDQKTNYYFITKEDIAKHIHIRESFSHKGNYGHALLLAGSYGRIGAAVLASQACLRAGVGLLTTQVPVCGYEIMQTSVPEAMVITDESKECLTIEPAKEESKVIGIGPGIGTDHRTAEMFQKLILHSKKPLVIDADAINILSQHKDWLELLPKDSILTPHPKEFDRLTKNHTTGWERHLTQISFSKRYKIILVLKGAHTSITDSKGNCWFNSSGNPGMATAGSGDVLTGIILSLLAQSYDPMMAACIGVFLHGLSGDIAKADWGENSLIASDLIHNLGKAFLSFNLKN